MRRALAVAALVWAGAAAASPELDYMLHCQGCHLPDGGGAPPEVPSLAGMGRFLGSAEGRAYLVRVPGSALSALADPELAAVLNWMLRRFDPARAARGFEPYTAEEVARERTAPLVEVAPLRARLLASPAP